MSNHDSLKLHVIHNNPPQKSHHSGKKEKKKMVSKMKLHFKHISLETVQYVKEKEWNVCNTIPWQRKFARKKKKERINNSKGVR